MRGVIIEGVTASGKTCLFHELQKLLAKRFPSNTKIVLSEHYSERILEHSKERNQLDEITVLEHLESLLLPLLCLREMKTQSKFIDRTGNTVVLVVVERFLLGHIANRKMQNESAWKITPAIDERVKSLYQKADKCGLARVILVLPDEQLEESIMSTLYYRNGYWMKYLETIGDRQKIVAYYKKWQRQLLIYQEKFCDTIKAEKIRIDNHVMQDKYMQVAKRIADQIGAAL